MTMEVVGYFSWTTRNGRISCEKCDADIRKNAMPETIARRPRANGTGASAGRKAVENVAGPPRHRLSTCCRR